MEKKIPMRRCAGCMESKPKKEMVRIAAYQGEITVDFSGKAKGRGLYICPDQECIAKAKKRKALQRAFEINISEDRLNKVFEELVANEK